MKLRALAALILLAATIHAAEISVVGSDLLGDGFARAVAEFAKRNDTAVKLDLHGTRPGVEDLAAGRADVGLFLLPPGENPPSETFVSLSAGYQVAVIAVPAASPLQQITVPQLRGLFGESTQEGFTRWGDLHLTGEWIQRPVALRALAPSAGLAWPLFARVILQDAAPRAALEFSDGREKLAERLRAAENTIGVTGASLAGATGMRVLPVAAGPTEPAYAPTSDNVHRGNYPLRMTLYVSFRRTEAPALQAFLKFLLSDEVAIALASVDFLPLPVGARNQLVFELEDMH